jgi:GT2 family glycosyltransferase/glycosyltransferase involved in cell wall biosynthesis/Tfp pilus assembly protein PilF
MTDKTEQSPVISILALNNLDLTRQCIESIFENTEAPFRICVVNQGSNDGTRGYLDGLGDAVDAIHSPRNLGFVTGNNRVIESFPGRDIVLLNNDTIVKKGWLMALRDCAHGDPGIGIVGAKLVYPDGRLQEAGGEIFQDGSGRNIGKFDDPGRHIYNLRRDVDYCSGACLYLKRAVLDRVGGLDEVYSPAYWEDTDICFRARAAGFRVVYEPEAEVVHLEGATAGSPGKKTLSAELQARNKPIFMERWGEELKKHRKNVFEVRTGSEKDKILVIQPFLPMYDRAAGEKRWFHTLKILTKRYDVVFLARNGAGQLKYINELEKMGVTVFHTDQSRLSQMDCDIRGPVWIDFPLLLKSNDFKAVIVGFYHVAHQYWRDIREHSPQSVFIIDSFDVCHIRQRRKALLTGDPGDLWNAEETRRLELAMYRRADMVLTVTEKDRAALLEEAPDLRVGISTDIHPVIDDNGQAERRDIVFVGNFNHDPNEDAVVFFMEDIWPKVKAKLPGLKFYIVGNAPTAKVEAYASPDVIVTGFVPEVIPYLRKARAFVVPLRYGAGLKGKIGEALSTGIPIVTTSVGAEGMDLIHRKSAMIADDPDEFAGSVAEACSDDGLWATLSREGKALAERNYSYETVEEYWEEVFKFIDAGRPEGPSMPTERGEWGYVRPGRAPEICPTATIVIPVYNQLETTRRCWMSIKKNTEVPYRLILVDNGSEEQVAYEADQNNIEVIRNETNTGFAHACNQGIRTAYGDYVIILNNDTVVPPGWLKRLLWHMEENPDIGIAGPSTSFASTIQQIPVSYKDERGLYGMSEEIYRKNRHEAAELPKVVGVCMALRRKMLDEIGLFDTRFGVGNFEDDDICVRARLAGYRVVWAKDVFVHHDGSKTFRSIDLDYEALMKENRGKFAAKWAPVVSALGSRGKGGEVWDAGEAAGTGQAGGGRPEYPSVPSSDGTSARQPVSRPSGTGIIVLAAKGGDALENTVRSLEESWQGPILVAGPPARGAVSPEAARNDAGGPLSRSLLDLGSECEGKTIFFVAEGAVVTPEWTVPLECLLEAEDAGCAVSSSNAGWGRQVLEPGYRRTGRPLLKFARKNALEHRGRVETLQAGFPGSLAIRKEVFLQAGLAPEFTTNAVLVDLQRRLRDAGKRILCAKDSYVHYDNGHDRVLEAEYGAALKLLAAGDALRAGDLETAYREVDDALRLKPDYVEAFYERGVLRALSGNAAGARSDFEKVLEFDPMESKAHNNLGCILHNAGEVGGAEEAFKKAIEADPANWEAKKNLADLYLAGGRVQEGMDSYHSLLREHKDRPEIYLSLAHVFARQGDTGTAALLLASAEKIAPGDTDVREALTALGAGGADSREVEPFESR